MSRLIIAAAFLCLVAFGFAWLVDHPGEVAVTWFGQRIETSTATAIVAGLVVLVIAVIFWRVVSLVLKGPVAWRRRMRQRAQEKGLHAVARGLIAVGAGDVTAAQKAAREADRHLKQSPLALLLTSQAAQLAGDREAATASFKAMLDHKETNVLGLRGLYVEARREGDHVRARSHAEMALQGRPSLAWAAHATLAYQAGAHDWDGALATLKRQADQRIISRDKAKRLRAVVLAAKGLDSLATDRISARALALEAHHAAPDLVPAAALAARLLTEAGEVARASRVIETSWRIAPHPDLADAYTHARLGDAAQDRVKRAKVLAGLAPDDRESSFALAAAYMEARDFDQARAALSQISGEPTRRYCLLHAHLSEAEGKEGEAREWFQRAANALPDPAWTADGYVSDRWLPVSPVTGDLDAFVWQAPSLPPGALPPAITLPHVPAPIDNQESRLLPAAEIMPPSAETMMAPPAMDEGAEEADTMKAVSLAEPAPVPEQSAKQFVIPDDPGPVKDADGEAARRGLPKF